ncbi:MAG: thiamine biosynthesis protein [Anaeromyxobacteraceae bacterium]
MSAPKAIGMISGGLDSTLALALVKRQGIEVKAVNFYTGFCITETQRRKGGRPDGTIPQNEALRAAADLEVDIEYVDVSDEGYLDLIVNPKHGYGANANPCVDCRIFMMQKAREIMEREGASFVFTGEVLGQRPKSQRRDTMRGIERKSGLEGRLVRPLSALLLEPTIPEREGILDRSRLLGISGRSRQPQIRLARELGITEWPQPAGGCCYLTDESFSRKFFDVLDAREAAGEERRIRKEDIVLLSTGRHFRLSPKVKLVVGRSEGENAILEAYGEGRARLLARDLNGPVALVEGTPTWEDRQFAARIVARYGKGRDLPQVAVDWVEDGVVETLHVEPERDEARIEALRI